MSAPSAAVAALSSTVILGVPNRLIASQGATKLRRLVADRKYFGLEASALRAGAERSLAHMSTQPPEQARIDVRSLGEAFHLDAPASWALLGALLTGGLLYPDGNGGYHPTRHFRDYALACVVAPLSRARAKALIDRVCGLAAHINADWASNPLRIKVVAVSGSYMSRRDQLAELSLWLVLRRRPETRARRWRPSMSKDDALRQILEPIHALSSFIVVRIVADRQVVQRPFSVVFEANEDVVEPSVPTWERFRDWGASISRRLASR
jgi:hypothetical protein